MENCQETLIFSIGKIFGTNWIQKDIERIEQQLKKQNDGDEKK